MVSWLQAPPVPLHVSRVQASPSSQSALVRQQVAIAALEHVPVPVSQLSTVHGFVSAQSVSPVHPHASPVWMQRSSVALQKSLVQADPSSHSEVSAQHSV
jgi:hypothetical protein